MSCATGREITLVCVCETCNCNITPKLCGEIAVEKEQFGTGTCNVVLNRCEGIHTCCVRKQNSEIKNLPNSVISFAPLVSHCVAPVCCSLELSIAE